MISGLSQPLNRRLQAIIAGEHRRLHGDSMEWVDNGCGSGRWKIREDVALEAQQVRVIYKLLFKEDLV